MLNVTAVWPAAPGWLSLYPAGPPWPGTAAANFAAGRVEGNNMLVSLGDGSGLTILNGSTATTNVIVDVFGYFK
jgi:hypothetical protein